MLGAHAGGSLLGVAGVAGKVLLDRADGAQQAVGGHIVGGDTGLKTLHQPRRPGTGRDHHRAARSQCVQRDAADPVLKILRPVRLHHDRAVEQRPVGCRVHGLVGRAQPGVADGLQPGQLLAQRLVMLVALLDRGLHGDRANQVAMLHLGHQVHHLGKAFVQPCCAGHEQVLEHRAGPGCRRGLRLQRVGHQRGLESALAEEIGHRWAGRQDFKVRLALCHGGQPPRLGRLGVEPVHKQEQLVRRDHAVGSPVRADQIGGAGGGDQDAAGLAQQAADQPKRLQPAPAPLKDRRQPARPLPERGRRGASPDGQVGSRRGGASQRPDQAVAVAGVASERGLDDVQGQGHGHGR